MHLAHRTKDNQRCRGVLTRSEMRMQWECTRCELVITDQVLADGDRSALKHFTEFPLPHPPRTKIRSCAYCRTPAKSKATRCVSCGAPIDTI